MPKVNPVWISWTDLSLFLLFSLTPWLFEPKTCCEEKILFSVDMILTRRNINLICSIMAITHILSRLKYISFLEQGYVCFTSELLYLMYIIVCPCLFLQILKNPRIKDGRCICGWLVIPLSGKEKLNIFVKFTKSLLDIF